MSYLSFLGSTGSKWTKRRLDFSSVIVFSDKPLTPRTWVSPIRIARPDVLKGRNSAPIFCSRLPVVRTQIALLTNKDLQGRSWAIRPRTHGSAGTAISVVSLVIKVSFTTKLLLSDTIAIIKIAIIRIAIIRPSRPGEVGQDLYVNRYSRPLGACSSASDRRSISR